MSGVAPKTRLFQRDFKLVTAVIMGITSSQWS